MPFDHSAGFPCVSSMGVLKFEHGQIEHQRRRADEKDVDVLMVDESKAGASGCSIDKSVHFIKSIGSKYQTEMFDRMNFAYKIEDEIKTADREEFVELYNNKTINDDTLVFDNLVSNKADFDQKWIKPLKDSWHSRLV